MTRWQQYYFLDRIRVILSDVHYVVENHHFGRPFLTPYQIAIEYSQRWDLDFIQIGLPIGGANTGSNSSLAKYIANQLSRRIKSGEISDIQGTFISNKNLSSITFNNHGNYIISSLTKTQNDLSMFRLTTP